MSKRHSPATPPPKEGLDLPELTPPRWNRHGDAMLDASWLRIARHMPSLLAKAAVLAWRSGPRDVVTTVLFNLGSGAATAWALIATTSVLGEFFTQVPTTERVVSALPSLGLLALALLLRGGCGALAGRAQARLEPRVVLAAERRLLRDATSVELRAFDDSEFHDHLFRSHTRGCAEAGTLVRQAVDLLTGSVGIVAAAGVLATLHPALVPLLLLALVPQWWGRRGLRPDALPDDPGVHRGTTPQVHARPAHDRSGERGRGPFLHHGAPTALRVRQGRPPRAGHPPGVGHPPGRRPLGR
ncbi:hypothetical protein ACWGSK_16525 [Nocardiopsis sp. NPDC055551]